MGNSNGYHCPRCIGGTLIKDTSDILCLNCGYRFFTATDREAARAYLTEAIISRLISDDSNEIADIMNRDFKLAGMAAEN